MSKKKQAFGSPSSDKDEELLLKIKEENDDINVKQEQLEEEIHL